MALDFSQEGAKMDLLVGFDIGGTKSAVIIGEKRRQPSAGEGRPQILARETIPTPSGAPAETIQRLTGICKGILVRKSLSLLDVRGIGISCGGPLDSQKGLILSPPNLVGWDEVPIVDLIEKELGCRPTLQNDANACAVAEWKFGAGRGLRNLVFLTFGTGLGAGLILDGRLYVGTNDMAGEVGHIRLENIGPVGYGKAGSFEGFCSGGGISQLAAIMVREKLQAGQKVAFCAGFQDLETLDARVVGDFAEKGDLLAQEIYRVSGIYLGKGLAILIDILNPQAIILGSIYTRREHLLWKAADEVIQREALALSRSVCRVLPAALGEQIGDYAALAVADYR
jgi:glucokinase